MRARRRSIRQALTGNASEPWWRLLTIVVCSSPVPSNPDTGTLRASFESLRVVPGLLRAPKLIQFDGPQPALPSGRVALYEEFKRRVRKLSQTHRAFARAQVYESSTFLFAAHNLAAAVARVNTSFLLSMQHDYQLVRPFDAPGLLRSMLTAPVVRHVRLNMRSNCPARGFDGVVGNATDLSARGVTVPLTRTCGWSDGPHVASTHYYRNFCIPLNHGDHNGGRRKFMEESLHYRMQRNFKPGGCWALKQAVHARSKTHPGPLTIRPHADASPGELAWPEDFDQFGTYLYGVCSPTDGTYTLHRSLRGNQPQWGLDHRPKQDLLGGTAPSDASAHAGRGRRGGRGGRGRARGRIGFRNR